MTECKIKSEDTLLQYLNSLNWIRDLKLLLKDALRRMKENMPKFIKEIEIQAEKTLDEFEKIDKKIRLFDGYYDIHEADNYAVMSRKLDEEL